MPREALPASNDVGGPLVRLLECTKRRFSVEPTHFKRVGSHSFARRRSDDDVATLHIHRSGYVVCITEFSRDQLQSDSRVEYILEQGLM